VVAEAWSDVDRMLYFFDYVPRNASDIFAIIETRASALFQGSTDTALDKTMHFQSQLQVEFAGREFSRDVEIELGKPQDESGRDVQIDLGAPPGWGHSIFIPIKWHSKDQRSLFPVMDAKLEITPLGDQPPLTQITLKGFYRPPLGPLGTVGDAMFMHRVAEASVRHFVSDLAIRLQDA
jgi:hypothetical protein